MKRLLFIMFALTLSINASAQRQGEGGAPRFDPQRFQQMVEEQLSREACLSQEERTAFFPIYNEMRAKQREMGRQIHQLKKSTPANAKAASEIINKINQLKVDMSKLESDYYKRIIKVVPPEKVLKLMRAEDGVYRRMVQRRDDHHGERRKPQGER
ncbi:MAG: hypothetical protein IJJ94_08040 [Bacteroidaceae bacterium]|nr:hypothetical protein [Bacteroidaceae bacterium]MBQ7460773.1 hypothetical protein [Bacteroidaceae bacterium]